ncbi:MAG: aminopeptidase P family protein [Proteobacteria bacterium]|nr:aminopeptidase P family protein [Pseudomonadota bacterium]
MDKLLRAIPSGMEAAFPKKEIDRRVRALQAVLAEKGLDLYLTSGAENIFYLSGQQTPGYYMFQCLGVPAKGKPFLVIRSLETYNARANSYLSDITGYADGTDAADALAGVLAKKGWKGRRVAVDLNAWFLTVNLFGRIGKALGRVEDGSGLVEALRRVKSPLELDAIARAAKANDAGMIAGLEAVAAGRSENDVAAAVMAGMIAAGSEYLGMEPFVTSGPRSGIPHSTWRRRRIRRGDVVILETAACYNRYHAALFRTVAVGRIPAKARDMFRVTEEALAAAIDRLRPGNTCADPHNAAQAVIDRHGYGYAYRKRSGYSIGISFAPDWGEGNILSLYKTVDAELRPGMVFHVPITLREYGKWTVAVSETVAVTKTGNRTLSRIPRDLVEV